MEAHAADLDTALADDDVAASFEARMRALEDERLSPLATRSYPPQRAVEELPCRLRTPFQRDRDRIVHTKSFRRLKHKTQVFIAPEGDHYRTRLTHTLETCGDLPDGRPCAAAERGPDRGDRARARPRPSAVRARRRGGARPAAARALRAPLPPQRAVAARRRRRSSATAAGLNLTEQVRDGILRHTGPDPPDTLEGRIVRLVDRIAYINHDIDDALRADVLAEGDLPREEIAILGATRQRADRPARPRPGRALRAGRRHRAGRAGRRRDVAPAQVHVRPRLPRASRRATRAHRVAGVIETLLDHYLEHPDELPEATAAREDDLQTRVTDYLAGMTDRFCIRDFERLSVPRDFS